MKSLLQSIASCTKCEKYLPHEPRPVVLVSPKSRVLIIGQAPGSRVHESGVPWDDPSGENLRKWLDVSRDEFYDTSRFGIMPMGFCYPGKGKSGDLPPRPECAPAWHQSLWKQMPGIELTLLIGQYAQAYYLGKSTGKNLTETVRNFNAYLPEYFVLPHPSPRNNIWQKKNAWFTEEVLPELRRKVKVILASSTSG